MPRRTEALLDSNVLIAALVVAHPHHAASVALFGPSGPHRFAVASHSFAETFSTLTRRGGRIGYAWPPEIAWRSLEPISAFVTLMGLTPAQTLDAIGAYAASGGVGPRLYDRLIGEVAVVHGFKRIVTWNVQHFRGLFPGLEIVTPAEVT